MTVYRPVYESESTLSPDRFDNILRQRIDELLDGPGGFLGVSRRELDGHCQQQRRECIVDEVEYVVFYRQWCSGSAACSVSPTLHDEPVPEGKVQKASSDGPVLAERQPEGRGVQAGSQVIEAGSALSIVQRVIGRLRPIGCHRHADADPAQWPSRETCIGLASDQRFTTPGSRSR
jgi:hypothetical protein